MNTTVAIPALHITGTLMGIVPARTAGGETRYRVSWREPLLNDAPREAGFWLEDFDDVTVALLAGIAQSQNGVAA